MRVLLLSTWLPYPLTHGGKVRAYHLLRVLAARHDVALVSFRDVAPSDAALHHLGTLCRRVEIVEREPFAVDRRREVLGFFSRRPRTAFAAWSRAVQRHVTSVAAEWRPDRVLALTTATAPYAVGLRAALHPSPRLIFDMDAPLTSFLRDAYEREAQGIAARSRRWLAWRKAQRYEEWLARRFDACLLASASDLALVRGMTARSRGPRIAVIPNGVDSAHHRPGLATPVPGTVVFNGPLAYAPNRDAMLWFVADVLPTLRAALPDVRLTITGEPGSSVPDALARAAGVHLAGCLPDVRGAVAASAVCVVPLRQGAGTRVKILEAMALGTPVVSTTKGAEGLEVRDGEHLLLADSARDFAAATLGLLRSPELRAALAGRARALVEARYDWRTIGERLRALVEDV